MKISIFSSQSCNVPFFFETTMIHPILLIGDEINTHSTSGDAILSYLNLDKTSEVDLFTMGKIFLNDDEEWLSIISSLEKTHPLIKKILKLKNKDKYALTTIGQYNNLLKELKSELRRNYEYLIHKNGYFELIQFVEQEIWRIELMGFDNKNSNEDKLIPLITNTIIKHKDIMAFAFKVDSLFTNSNLDKIEDNGFDFIKIPLWDFPAFPDILFTQMKYTRDNLLPHLIDFKKDLGELSDQLIDISFLPENHQQIRQICTKKLNHHLQPVQNIIGDSLYLKQLKNIFHKDMGLRFCLGVASIETLIDYYEKSKILLPYVASEVKNRVSKHIDLKKTEMFCYLMMLHKSKTKTEDI